MTHRGEKCALGPIGLLGRSTCFSGGVHRTRHLSLGLLELTDVRVHGNRANVLDLPLADLEPTAVAELLHIGSTRVAIPCQALGNPCVDSAVRVRHPTALGNHANDLFKRHPHQAVRGGGVCELPIPAVAEYEPILRVVEREGF